MVRALPRTTSRHRLPTLRLWPTFVFALSAPSISVLVGRDTLIFLNSLLCGHGSVDVYQKDHL